MKIPLKYINDNELASLDKISIERIRIAWKIQNSIPKSKVTTFQKCLKQVFRKFQKVVKKVFKKSKKVCKKFLKKS